MENVGRKSMRLKSTINQADLIGIYGTLYLTRAENITPKCTWKIHQLDHILGEKQILTATQI